LATITAVTLSELEQFALDMSTALTVSKVLVNGKRAAHSPVAADKLRIRLASKLATGAALSIVVHYGGSPGPLRSLWATSVSRVDDGVLIAGQPNGAATWFPATTTPAPKPRSASGSAPKPLPGDRKGKLVSRRARASQTVWTYEQTRTDIDLPRHLADRRLRNGMGWQGRRRRYRRRCPDGCVASSTRASPANPR